jgi:alpha-1,2-mannosyltransferase
MARTLKEITPTQRWLVVALTVAVVAVAARLVPLLRGGGLFGLGNYDDAVYYSSAIALAHGKLPYRDFLLLHPPGIVLALTPFALIGRLTTDSTGFALARLGWMVLGCLNAVMVSRILRPVGLIGALFGGLCYAVLYPAVYVEWTTQLQGLGNTCLLLALVLLIGSGPGRPVTTATIVAAGAMLGAAASVKIWGAMAALLVLGWMAFAPGRRQAAKLFVGIVLGAVVICLPFFASAPQAMWHYVVTAQLGRQRTGAGIGYRLVDIAGLQLYHGTSFVRPLVLVFCTAAIAVVLALAWTERLIRLAVVLFLGLSAVLLVGPSWFSHYSALTAPPLAICFGAAVQKAMGWLGAKSSALAVLSAASVTVVLVALAAPLMLHSFGRPFPGRTLAKGVTSLSGCVVADNPAALIEMNVFGRNVRRGCRLIVDMGGYSYVVPRASGDPFPRSRDAAWQEFALSQMRSASGVIFTNYKRGDGLSNATADELDSWRVLVESGGFTVHAPTPQR